MSNQPKPLWLTDKQKELNLLKYQVRKFLKKLAQYQTNLTKKRLDQVIHARKRMADNRKS